MTVSARLALRRGLARISRDALLLLLGTFIASVPVGWGLVVLPIYLKRVGLDPALIGLLYTISGLASALLLVLSGLAADRLGRKPFLVAGAFLPALSYAVFALTTESGWLLAASAIGGVGLAGGVAGALAGASFDALLAEKTDERNRTGVFTLAAALWTVALGAGSFLAGLPEWLRAAFALGELESYRPAFALAIVLTLAGGALVLPVAEERRRASGPVGWLPRRSGRTIARVAVTYGLLGLGLGIVVQLLPLWFFLRHGVSEALLGPWYGGSEVLALFGLAVVPWLIGRIGGVGTVALTQFAAAVALLLMPLAPAWQLAAGLYAARNILMNMSWPAQQATVMSLVASSERATAAGFAFAVWGLANAVGPSVGGALLGAGEFTLPFVAGALGYALSAVLFWRFLRRAEPQGDPSVPPDMGSPSQPAGVRAAGEE
jgi:MFS family permease